MNTKNTPDSSGYEKYVPSYSVQVAGSKFRILATQQGTTTALVTVANDVANDIASRLAELAIARTEVLHLHARRIPGEVCYYRRNMMAALLAGADRRTGESDADPLLAAAAGCTEAERRSIADEVGRLLDGTEDVIVACYVEDGIGETSVLEIANGWLNEELATRAPAKVAVMLSEVIDGESGWLYEGLLAHLRTQDTENGELIDSVADRNWVDVSIDERALVTWMRRNVPDHLDELEGLVDDVHDPADFGTLPEFTAGAHLLARLS